jgi:hypothetical protein
LVAHGRPHRLRDRGRLETYYGTTRSIVSASEASPRS